MFTCFHYLPSNRNRLYIHEPLGLNSSKKVSISFYYFIYDTDFFNFARFKHRQDIHIWFMIRRGYRKGRSPVPPPPWSSEGGPRGGHYLLNKCKTKTINTFEIHKHHLESFYLYEKIWLPQRIFFSGVPGGRGQKIFRAQIYRTLIFCPPPSHVIILYPRLFMIPK